MVFWWRRSWQTLGTIFFRRRERLDISGSSQAVVVCVTSSNWPAGSGSIRRALSWSGFQPNWWGLRKDAPAYRGKYSTVSSANNGSEKAVPILEEKIHINMMELYHCSQKNTYQRRENIRKPEKLTLLDSNKNNKNDSLLACVVCARRLRSVRRIINSNTERNPLLSETWLFIQQDPHKA